MQSPVYPAICGARLLHQMTNHQNGKSALPIFLVSLKLANKGDSTRIWERRDGEEGGLGGERGFAEH